LESAATKHQFHQHPEIHK